MVEQGLTFEKPEVVPFRLTHNMVDAFGAYGYNGKQILFFLYRYILMLTLLQRSLPKDMRDYSRAATTE